MDSDRKIVVVAQQGSERTRNFDFCAHFDGDPEGKRGFGATEQEAIDDLKENEELIAQAYAEGYIASTFDQIEFHRRQTQALGAEQPVERPKERIQ